ncbi:alpha/beta hydrolase [Marinomonas gallaica]|uniref:alpha/beta hydrolase n=1 Tax=Marinomonas gallaica TaxID=1806667 RepID=UPI003A8FC07C
MKLSSLFTTVAAVIGSGCTQVGVNVANIPSHFGDVTRHENISYGNLPEQTLDIYTPQQETGQRHPVIVFFYGGSWQDGHKEMYPFVAKPFVDRGYIVVIPDYRKYPQVKFPSFVEDGADAIVWTLNNIGSFQGNPDNLFVMGHSAGAQIGALISADEQYLSRKGHSNQSIKAFAGLSGPYDFIPMEEDLKDIFGPPERYPQMTVTTFIDGNEPPMLLMWGEEDTLVGQRNIDLLSTKIKLERGRVTTKTFPEMGHVDMISNLIWFLPSEVSIDQEISDFFARQH